MAFPHGQDYVAQQRAKRQAANADLAKVWRDGSRLHQNYFMILFLNNSWFKPDTFLKGIKRYHLLVDMAISLKYQRQRQYLAPGFSPPRPIEVATGLALWLKPQKYVLRGRDVSRHYVLEGANDSD